MNMVKILLISILIALVDCGNRLRADMGPKHFIESIPISLLQSIFPGAETAGRPSGRIVAAPVYGEVNNSGFLSIVGYAFSVGDLLGTEGYAGESFEIISAVDMNGIITGAALIAHQEPLVGSVASRLPLEEMVSALSGLDVLDSNPIDLAVYAEGAKRSSLIMLEAVYEAGRAVAVSRELYGPGEREGRRLDLHSQRELSWKDLLSIGAVRSAILDDSFVFSSTALDVGSDGVNGLFATAKEQIFLALASPRLIRENLLANDLSLGLDIEEPESSGALIWLGAGGSLFPEEVALSLKDDTQALFELSLRQNGWVKSLNGVLTREVESVPFLGLSRAWLLTIESQEKFDPTRPWAIQIKSIGDESYGNTWSLPYSPPQEIVIEPIPHQVAVEQRKREKVTPLWVSVWLEASSALAIMFLAFLILCTILVLQGTIVRTPKTLRIIKNGFMVFTLIWVGWYTGAQLSVMHLLSLMRAPKLQWSLESLLLDPLIVIIMGFTLIVTLLLGRGVFCGWLCPFGALQDVVSQLSRWLSIKQLNISSVVNRRLWALKYFVLIGLVSLTFFSPVYLSKAIEVEPFNTVIMTHFIRSWPYTLFALLLLGISLFVERPFCRYLCPLGAGLAIAGRIRVLEWLKRRPECGSSCNICRDLCPVQAIQLDGEINISECYQCLKCQTAYYDDMVCPPLIQRRERREKLVVS